MSNPRYPEEFKIQAVNQVTEKKLPVAEDDQHAELRRLRAELKRVTEDRDILKKAAAYFAKECG